MKKLHSFLLLATAIALSMPSTRAYAQSQQGTAGCTNWSPGDTSQEDNGVERLCQSDESQRAVPLDGLGDIPKSSPNFKGCDDSPENSTLVLAALAVAAFVSTRLRAPARNTV